MKHFPPSSVCTYSTIVLVLAVLVLASGFRGRSAAAAKTPEQVRIGVLAKRGKKQCMKRWEFIASYLSKEIRDTHFSVMPLPFDKINSVVSNQEVDFIFVNPAIYVELESKYQVTRIATICNIVDDKCCTEYGSVIFVRADSPIKNIQGLKQKRISAVSRTSLGGWLIALRQLEHFFHVPGDFLSLDFLGTHDAVVLAVLHGKVDAGIVRTDALERMHQEGKISITDFQVLEAGATRSDKGGFPFLLSTPLYPEWPMAKLKYTSDELAKKVVAALFAMQGATALNGNSFAVQWTIPLSYQSVHALLRELRLGPYKNYGLISIKEAAIQHWPAILGLFLFGLLLAAFALYSARMNRRLKMSQYRVEQELLARQEEEARRKTVESMVRHEFRSPVITIYNGLNLLEDVECLDSSLLEVFQLSKDAAERALKAIDLQGQLNTIENKTFVPPETRVDLLALVREVLGEYTEQACLMDVRWELQLPSSMPETVMTKGDRELYAVLFSNLLRNALEAVSPGSAIRIVFEALPQPVVRISNPGAVPEIIRDSFFERFATADKSGGIGLGTYIVKIIAEGHGGSVSMRTSEEEGTEISVVFPYAEGSEAVEAKEA